MSLYVAYGLCIQSDVPLVGLLEGVGPPDVVIRKRDLTLASLLEIPTDDQVCWGSVHGLAQFVVRYGAEIEVDPRGIVSEEVLGSFVTGVLMAILLRQRGLFPLHASCVEKEGIALGFAGKSGWGKSTLAEYFHQRGYQVLCDDLLALRMEGGGAPLVIPGYPHIRLTEEVGADLVDDFDSLPPLPYQLSKRLRTISQSEGPPVPLHRLYLLDGDSAPETKIEYLAAGDAFREIPEHAWATTTIADPRSKTQYLQHCAALINTVPIARLRRVRTLEALGEHFNVIEQDLCTGGVST